MGDFFGNQVALRKALASIVTEGYPWLLARSAHPRRSGPGCPRSAFIMPQREGDCGTIAAFLGGIWLADVKNCCFSQPTAPRGDSFSPWGSLPLSRRLSVFFRLGRLDSRFCRPFTASCFRLTLGGSRWSERTFWNQFDRSLLNNPVGSDFPE